MSDHDAADLREMERDEMRQEIDRLQKDRDALLAACKEANRYLRQLCTCSQCLGKQAELKSVIAQVESP